jgi:hypothetical protein
MEGGGTGACDGMGQEGSGRGCESGCETGRQMMAKQEPIDVTDVMAAEEQLMFALKDWRDAGGPVVSIVDCVVRLIDAKIDLRDKMRPAP